MFGPADTNLSPYDDLGLWRAFEVPFVIGLLFLFISGFSDRLSSWGRGSIVIFTLLILMEIVAGWMMYKLPMGGLNKVNLPWVQAEAGTASPALYLGEVIVDVPMPT